MHILSQDEDKFKKIDSQQLQFAFEEAKNCLGDVTIMIDIKMEQLNVIKDYLHVVSVGFKEYAVKITSMAEDSEDEFSDDNDDLGQLGHLD